MKHCIAKRIFSIALVLLLIVLSACGNDKSSEENAYISLAEEYIAEGNYDAALNVLEKGMDATDSELMEQLMDEIIDATMEPQLPEEAFSTDTSSATDVPPPTEDQIAQDLIACNENQISLNGQIETLDIKGVKILKRKTTSNYDEVWVDVRYENETYRVFTEYMLYYSYYDVGGWILDSGEETYYASMALRSTLDESVVQDACSAHFSTFEITSRETGLNEDEIFVDQIHFQGTIVSTFVTEKFTGSYTHKFENNYWCDSWEITPEASDWSRVIGSWSFEHSDEYIYLNITDISQIDSKTLRVTYDYETSPWCDNGPWEGYFNAKTDGSKKLQSSTTQTFEISYTSTDFKGGEKYNGETYNSLSTHAAIGIPIEVGGWYGDYGPKQFILYLNPNDGFTIKEFRYLYKNPQIQNSWDWLSATQTVRFDKERDVAALQDAINRLNQLNGGN